MWRGWMPVRSDWWTVEDWYDLIAYDTQWERDEQIVSEYRNMGLPIWRR